MHSTLCFAVFCYIQVLYPSHQLQGPSIHPSIHPHPVLPVHHSNVIPPYSLFMVFNQNCHAYIKNSCLVLFHCCCSGSLSDNVFSSPPTMSYPTTHLHPSHLTWPFTLIPPSPPLCHLVHYNHNHCHPNLFISVINFFFFILVTQWFSKSCWFDFKELLFIFLLEIIYSSLSD